jgi:hypothetical protein
VANRIRALYVSLLVPFLFPPLSVASPSSSRYHSTTVARSKYAQNAFANCICRGLLHSGSNNRGLPTTITAVIAREVATLNLFKLYKNSIPRGASSGVELVSE